MSIIQRKQQNASIINAPGAYKLLDFYVNQHDYVSLQMHALKPGNPTNRRLSAAPHIVSMCKTVFIATTRYCVVTTEEKAEGANHDYIFRELEEENDPAARDVYTFREVDKPAHLKPIMDKFVKMLAPTKKYTFWIFNPLDYFNEVSPLAVLVSIWKNLQGREPEIGDTERLESVLFAVLDEFNIKIDARKTVLTATLEGSKEQFHIRPKSGDGEKITRVPNKWFFKTCSMSTIVTNVEMTPEKTPFLPDDVLIAELEDCFNSATDDLKIRKSVSEMGKIMRRFSDARMELRSGNNENIVFDIDMDVGISKFETANETSGNINGHEIKTNGGLCLYNGENYWRQTLTFFVNTSEILKQTKEVIESIMFELILPSAGAVFNPAWGSSEPTHRAVLKLQKLPEKVVDPKVYPQVITVNPDKKPTGATEPTGEPNAKRARPDHDDTYDGSDDSMA